MPDARSALLACVCIFDAETHETVLAFAGAAELSSEQA
jgi:hypothetical protein